MISKDVYQKIFDVFLKTIADLKTKAEVEKFFQDFLTPTERIMLAKRLAIGLLLAKKYDYRDISKILRVSTTTVANMSILYKYGQFYRKIIDEIESDEQMKEFWLEFGEGIAGVLAVGGAKASGWFNLRNEIRKTRKKEPF